ncbi:MAG: hypothetical protein AAGI46_12480 [Planctomycetota bacterium]
MVIATCGTGCISSQLYNASPDQYLRPIAEPSDETVGADLAIIEFDEVGMLWEPDQVEAAVELIQERNQASERGIVLVTFTHGWMNDADPDRKAGDLQRFRDSMQRLAVELKMSGAPAPDHVVGVYIGWRGATTRFPLVKSLTFWSRKAAAERVASPQMRETLFRLTDATKMRPDSKVFLSGHSMGGMILAKAIAPVIATKVMSSRGDGVPVPVDLVLLQNPALDGLAVYQLLEFMKRNQIKVELRHEDGSVRRSVGPLIVSITSEADTATRVAYPFGQIVNNLLLPFQDSLGEGLPPQSQLANRAHGHIDFLVSHRAKAEDGKLILTGRPDAFNDTPFWIIRTDNRISADHGDIYNPRFLRLVSSIAELNDIYDTQLSTWIVRGDHDDSANITESE